MMRIAMFFWSLELGGVEHMMVQLSRELAARGHAVSLVLARAATETEYLPDDRVSVIRLDAATTGLTVLRLARHLRRARYDLVYTAMPTSNIVALAAIWLSRAKSRLVISERSNPRLEAQYSQTWRYRAAFALQRFCYPRADRIVAVSHDLADDLADFARLPRQKIHVIYNPAFDDRASVAASGPTHPWLDEKVTPVILAAGRLTAQKDFVTLIKAFGQLRSKLNVRLMILGEGRERQNLKDLIDALGLADDVALPGFVPDIFPYLQKADVFALSSIWEGFGNVLVQAMAAGCSIVSTECPNGPGEILARGAFGRLVPVGDIAGFANALEQSLALPFAAAALRERAGQFSLTQSADAYEQLFVQLTGEAA